jgi:putative FmdB family regulatory protein
MPTYQYACNACNREFEVFQAFSDSSLTHCPTCNGEVRKVYSAVGVVFKGAGFYKTDSKTDSKKDSKSSSPATSSVAPKELTAPKATPEIASAPATKTD